MPRRGGPTLLLELSAREEIHEGWTLENEPPKTKAAPVPCMLGPRGGRMAGDDRDMTPISERGIHRTRNDMMWHSTPHTEASTIVDAATIVEAGRGRGHGKEIGGRTIPNDRWAQPSAPALGRSFRSSLLECRIFNLHLDPHSHLHTNASGTGRGGYGLGGCRSIHGHTYYVPSPRYERRLFEGEPRRFATRTNLPAWLQARNDGGHFSTRTSSELWTESKRADPPALLLEHPNCTVHFLGLDEHRPDLLQSHIL